MTSEEAIKGAQSPYSAKMGGQLKGHMALKSNAFSPTCKRLSTQDMVMENMHVHHRKVHTAKPRIDSTVPQSWNLSIKKKDQLKRQTIAKGMKPPSRSSSRAGSAVSSIRQRSTSGLVASTKHLQKSSSLGDLNFLDDDPVGAYQSPRSTQSFQRPVSRMRSVTPSAGQGGSKAAQKQSSDLLDQMASRFTEAGRSFTPRTLRTTAQSRLAQSKNYNPPRRKRTGTLDEKDTKNSTYVYGETERENLTPESLDAHFANHKEMDQKSERAHDHIRWVEEQARRVEKLNLNDSGKSQRRGRDTVDMNGTLEERDHRYYSAKVDAIAYKNHSKNEVRMKEEEEELRYLEFVTDVTNDVLNRGIYTNVVLKQVFEAHINRNKDRLEEGRMRHLMKQLQQDLAIPDSDDEKS